MEALRLVAKATTKSVGATAEEKVAIIKRKWPFYPQSHEEHMRLPLKNIIPSLEKCTLHMIIKHEGYTVRF